MDIGGSRRWLTLAAGTIALTAGCTFQYGLAYLIPALRAHGLSLEQENATTWHAELTPTLRFHDAFLLFAALADLPVDTLLAMADDELWRTRPEIVETMNEALKEHVYTFQRSDIYLRKDTYIRDLLKELTELKGSRLVRYALKGREIIARLRR